MDDAALTALLERTALGDQTAFAKLYRKSAPSLFALSLRILQDRGEAEEVLADSYLKIWRYAERFRAANVAPTVWMAAIVRNLAIERLRAGKAPAAALKAAETLAANTERADERALNRNGSAKLAACLDGLDAQESRLVRVAYFGGATYGALAERDGTSAGTARQTMRRALSALKSCVRL